MFVSNNTDGIQTGENLWHCAAKHTSSDGFFSQFFALIWLQNYMFVFLNLWSHKRFYIQFVTLSQFKRNIFMLRYHLKKTLLRNSVLQNTIPLLIRLTVFTVLCIYIMCRTSPLQFSYFCSLTICIQNLTSASLNI